LNTAVDLGVEGGEHPRPRVWRGAEGPAEGPITVGPGAQRARALDRLVRRPLVAPGVLDAPALVAQLLGGGVLGPLDQSLLFSRVARRGVGHRLDLRLGELPGTERLGRGRELF
jgi:hypothetical protein